MTVVHGVAHLGEEREALPEVEAALRRVVHDRARASGTSSITQ
jgi:hypothetical protein